jgi:tetratricopeptide (TPR) repeat protein
LGLFASAPEGQVERDLTNAIRIKPSSSEPHGWYAQHLARLSNAIDAREAVRRALELDPVSPGMRAAAAMVDAIGDEWNRALETARQARIAAPKWIGGPLIEAVALMNLGRAEECLGIEVLAPPIQAMCMQAMGRSREAGDMARSAEADWMAGNRPPRSTMYLVWYYASSGQIEKSIEWLEREFAYSPMGEPLGLPRGVFGRALQTEGRVPSNVRAPSPRILGSDRAGEPFGSAALTEARLASPSSRASQVFTRRCCGAGDPAATGRPGS